MIVEFEPNRTLLSCPPQWWIYYKNENEPHFNKICVTYEKLKLFLETYGYETNDILELKNFGIDTKNIKHNRPLK
jgi:hypothetical protein